jgi:hypothetical protein
MAQIIALQPSTVILDVTNSEITQLCSLSKLLASLARLKIIRLDLQQKQIQVVTSEQRPAADVHDLVEVIEPSSPG